MAYYSYYHSPIGKIYLLCRESALAGRWFEGQKYFALSPLAKEAVPDDGGYMPRVKQALDMYFAGENPDMKKLNLAPAGGEFRRIVWELLRRIPYGQTVTYGSLAKKAAQIMGKSSMSAQAVGGAVGHNPISVIVPCHRVLGSDGSLTGYAGGTDKKLWLLRHENPKIDTAIKI